MAGFFVFYYFREENGSLKEVLEDDFQVFQDLYSIQVKSIYVHDIKIVQALLTPVQIMVQTIICLSNYSK